MPKNNSNNKRKMIDKILTSLGVVAVLVLAGIGGLAWWAYSFTSSNVHSELSAQKITFPAKGSAAIKALPAADQAAMNQYGGQQLLTGPQAKTYADNFIGVHLNEIGGGQTYSQVSAASLADPTNAKLKGQAQTLFQGETLRGLLLNAYAFGTIGNIARIAAIVCFVAAAAMALLVLSGFVRILTE